ncbi:MAG: hypothetical protein QNL62_19900 [Gammaproteobacteria bacterium]|nr:hypothetical protein [Gammaproteobacteria bacterium]
MAQEAIGNHQVLLNRQLSHTEGKHHLPAIKYPVSNINECGLRHLWPRRTPRVRYLSGETTSTHIPSTVIN